MARSNFAAVLAVLVSATAHAQQLTHTAPWLGRTLELELQGVPSSTPCWLFASTAQGDVATPFGQLEIDLASAFPLFVGDADANGRVHLALDVPADVSLAELPLHLQALYADPAQPAGAALVPARHLRLLGSRFYALLRQSVPGLTTRRLEVYSSPSLERPFTIELGGIGCWQDEAGTVFVTDDGASAVWVACDGLIWFDNFFGQHHSHVPLPISGPPVVAADGEHLLVTAGGPSATPGVYRVPLEPGAPPVLLPHLPVAPVAGYDSDRDALWSESVVGITNSVGAHLHAIADGALLDRAGWALDGDKGAVLRAARHGLVAARRQSTFIPYWNVWFEVRRPGEPTAVFWLGGLSFPEPSLWRFGDTSWFLARSEPSGTDLAKQFLLDAQHATFQSLHSNLLFQPMLPLVDGKAFAYAPTTAGQLYELDPAAVSVKSLGGPDLPWASTGALVTDFTGVRIAFASCEQICSTTLRPIALVDPATLTVTQTDTVYASARLAACSIPSR